MRAITASHPSVFIKALLQYGAAYNACKAYSPGANVDEAQLRISSLQSYLQNTATSTFVYPTQTDVASDADRECVGQVQLVMPEVFESIRRQCRVAHC
jgi:hypothetical protein